MIKELISICESQAPTVYGRKKELNNKLKTSVVGDYFCLFEEPTTSYHRVGALKGVEPSTLFTFAFVSPVPLQGDSLGNIDIIEKSCAMCNRLIDVLLGSRRFRVVDGAVTGRKVEETEYSICLVGWRITINLVDLKRERC